MTFGSGDYTFELDENWGRLPEGYEFFQVAGVAVDNDDQVYVYNRSAHPLMVFDREGNFVKSWGVEFANPHDIHIAPDGSVFLADRDVHVVLKYSPDERLLLTLGTRDRPSDTGYTLPERVVHRAAGPFNLPTGIAVTADTGDIFVSDGYGNARVHKYNSTGALITSWGAPGSANPVDFNLPHGVTLDNEGNLVVCDRENIRLQFFSPLSTTTAISWPAGATTAATIPASSSRRTASPLTRAATSTSAKSSKASASRSL